MLVPLTREAFDRLIPPIATYPQYQFYWGQPTDFIRRLAISVVGVVVTWLFSLATGDAIGPLWFMIGFAAALYWFWAPVYLASLRNSKSRKLKYCGFWEGEILDVYVTEELVGQEETVNQQGELVIVENRERCINLEVGDDTGFETRLQAPLRRDHKGIKRGMRAQTLILSDRPDLSRVAQVADFYLPDRALWVSDYPLLQREAFEEVSRELTDSPRDRRSRRVNRPNPPVAPASVGESRLARRPDPRDRAITRYDPNIDRGIDADWADPNSRDRDRDADLDNDPRLDSRSSRSDFDRSDFDRSDLDRSDFDRRFKDNDTAPRDRPANRRRNPPDAPPDRRPRRRPRRDAP